TPPLLPDPNQRVPTHPPTDYTQAGIGSRLTFSNVRGTIFGLGPYTGFDASVSLRVDHPVLGATYRHVTLSYASAGYWQPPWGRTPMFSARLVGAIRAGDLVRNGGFGLGGIPAQDIVMAIVNSTRAGAS